MNVKIFENGKHINTIVSDEAFAAKYCAKHGYTYEVEPEPPAPKEYTELQQLAQQMTDLELMILEMKQNV